MKPTDLFLMDSNDRESLSNTKAASKTKLNIAERKFILFFGDLFISAMLILAFMSFTIYSFDSSITVRGVFLALGLFIYFFLAYVLDFYYLGKGSGNYGKTMTKSLIVSVFFSLSLTFATTILYNPKFKILELLLFYIAVPVIFLSWRLVFHKILFETVAITKKAIYLHSKVSPKTINRDLDAINGTEIKTYYEVCGVYDITSFKEEKPVKPVNEIDSIILETDSINKLPKGVEHMLLNSLINEKEVLTFSSFYENIYEAIPINKDFSSACYEILQMQHTKIRYIHRMFTIFVNAILTLLVGVLFLLVIPFVWFFNLFLNKGPLFFKQERIGINGKPFYIYKFRSMVIDAEKKGAKMATKNDARITPFGKILRQFRIDELPQVISIFRRDMLFIGPRPERQVFVDELKKISPYYNVRHLIRPGITGWAQVKYKYGENLEDSMRKLEYDLYYIKNRSVTMDLKIIFKTITTVLFSKGI